VVIGAGDVGRIRGKVDGRAGGAVEGGGGEVVEGAGVDVGAETGVFVGVGCAAGSAGLWGGAQFSSRESSRGMPSNTSWVANVRSSAACTVRYSDGDGR
jgi:hypothetical protein